VADARSWHLEIQEHGEQAVISFLLTILDERAGRPIGNPFAVRALWESSFGRGDIREIGTGLAMKLGPHYEFRFSSLMGDVYILGYRIDPEDGEIVMAIFSTRNTPLSEEAPEIARVSIVESQMTPVRFVENRDGKRVIVGTPEEVKGG
jgi:hypothetical protein